jgi:hypothetical protein
MIIELLAQRSDKSLSIIKNGDALTINGVDYDFTQLPEGGVIPQSAIDCEFLGSDVKRIDGKINIKIILPHSGNASEAARFPEPIVDPQDGELVLPQ